MTAPDPAQAEARFWQWSEAVGRRLQALAGGVPDLTVDELRKHWDANLTAPEAADAILSTRPVADPQEAPTRDPLEWWISERLLAGKSADYTCSLAEMVPGKVFPVPELEALLQLDVPTLQRVAAALRLLAQQPAQTDSPEALSPERIQELLDMEQEHKALLELRLNDYTLKPGTMDLSLNGEPARMFAAGVVSLFKDNGAENNFEVQVDLRDPASPHERYLLLIQRLHRPTPAEQRAVAQAEAETLRQEIKLYRGDPYSMDRDDPNYREGLEATDRSLADDLQGMSAFGALVPFARGRARAAADHLRAQDKELKLLWAAITKLAHIQVHPAESYVAACEEMATIVRALTNEYGCEDCRGQTFEDGTLCCWTCGRELPSAQGQAAEAGDQA